VLLVFWHLAKSNFGYQAVLVVLLGIKERRRGKKKRFSRWKEKRI